ncbi:MAG: hypothetical protein GTO15_11035 [Pseudomonas stutzeri]|nr:hypothetical protein [Stutzerimonas stutzeri]
MTEQQHLVMDKAIDRLQRLYFTAYYLKLWWSLISEEEKQLHLSRIIEDLGNSAQVASYWRDFAHLNGIKLLDE